MKKQQINPTLKDYAFILIGSILLALSYNMFFLPSKLAAGGVSGISTILYELYEITPALTQLVINVPIFIIGWFAIGKDFSWKTLFGTIAVPVIIYLTKDIPFTVTNPFLGAVYGGIMLGVGLGIVYLGNGSTGGTTALAQIVKKFTGISSGYSQLLVDGLVVISSLIVFNLELTLFALMAIYICSKAIDFVQLRTASNKLIMIITNEEDKVKTIIKNEIDRGFTKVRSIGGYTNEEKTMLLCVAEQQEAVLLRKMLEKELPDSFVIFIDASEIMGRGFSIDRYYGQKL